MSQWTVVVVMLGVFGLLCAVAGAAVLYGTWWLDQRMRARRRAARPVVAPPRTLAPPPPMVPLTLTGPALEPGEERPEARYAAEPETIHERRPEVRALWELEPDRVETVQARRVDGSRRRR